MSSFLMMFARRNIMTLQEHIEYDAVACVITKRHSRYIRYNSPLSGGEKLVSPQACVVDSLAENDDNDIHERIDHGAGTHWDKIRRDILA